MDTICKDKMLLNDWFVVGEHKLINNGTELRTFLLGEKILIIKDKIGNVSVLSKNKVMPMTLRYGFIWTSLGKPKDPIINIPEACEYNRHIITGGATQVNTSGLRVVENFLDQSHLAFVHPGYLGEEPHTEIKNYNVALVNDEIMVTDVNLYQPSASPAAKTGAMVAYEWRVYKPYIVALYKANPVYPDKRDYIVLFIQPIDEENCIVHSYLCFIKDGLTKEEVRWFMQVIFHQDKPILENQIPKRLPLNPRSETPIKADEVSIVYRRWLNKKSISYGAIINSESS